MAVKCPNRTRTKRISKAGGTPGCQGRLEVILTVPIVVPCKSLQRPYSAEATLTRRALKGARVKPDAILEAFASKATSDIRCSLCGWSYRRLMAGLNLKAKKR